jgi:hypothetical protein
MKKIKCPRTLLAVLISFYLQFHYRTVVLIGEQTELLIVTKLKNFLLDMLKNWMETKAQNDMLQDIINKKRPIQIWIFFIWFRF